MPVLFQRSIACFASARLRLDSLHDAKDFTINACEKPYQRLGDAEETGRLVAAGVKAPRLFFGLSALFAGIAGSTKGMTSLVRISLGTGPGFLAAGLSRKNQNIFIMFCMVGGTAWAWLAEQRTQRNTTNAKHRLDLCTALSTLSLRCRPTKPKVLAKRALQPLGLADAKETKHNALHRVCSRIQHRFISIERRQNNLEKSKIKGFCFFDLMITRRLCYLARHGTLSVFFTSLHQQIAESLIRSATEIMSP